MCNSLIREWIWMETYQNVLWMVCWDQNILSVLQLHIFLFNSVSSLTQKGWQFDSCSALVYQKVLCVMTFHFLFYDGAMRYIMDRCWSTEGKRRREKDGGGLEKEAAWRWSVIAAIRTGTALPNLLYVSWAIQAWQGEDGWRKGVRKGGKREGRLRKRWGLRRKDECT